MIFNRREIGTKKQEYERYYFNANYPGICIYRSVRRSVRHNLGRVDRSRRRRCILRGRRCFSFRRFRNYQRSAN